MDDTFHARLTALSEPELRQRLTQPLDYRTEAVTAAVAELERRGLPPTAAELAALHALLAVRDSAAAAQRRQGLVARLGATFPARLRRIRLISALLLALGLGSAGILWLAAPPPAPNPLGYEPTDTKKYLRDLELYGGKVNVLATEGTAWWAARWQGRNLAVTVAVLTLALAAGFLALATRRARDLEAADLPPAP